MRSSPRSAPSPLTPLYRRAVERALSQAGICIGGDAPWDVTIHDERVYRRLCLEHSVGAGEAYMDGWWGCERLDLLFYRLFRAHRALKPGPVMAAILGLAPKVMNLQSQRRTHRVNEAHYDLDVDLYQAMLGPTMVYSCGYWAGTDDLQEAQIQKLDLVCRKLGLKPGMTLLDIGCGYGAFVRHAAAHYGVTAVGYTYSREQQRFAQAHCEGLPVTIRFGDYRTIEGSYDRVASIGMFEAVGAKNIPTFMGVVARCLKPDGAALIHTIGKDEPRPAQRHWVDKYIFPHGYLPQLAEIVEGSFGRLRVEDLHGFGPDYDRTLMAWHDRFQAAWPQLDSLGPRFKRMWELYLLLFAGGFRARHWQLWQILFTPMAGLNAPSTRESVHGPGHRVAGLAGMPQEDLAHAS